jgi:hypothetical protein
MSGISIPSAIICTAYKYHFLCLLPNLHIRQAQRAIDGVADEPLSGKRHHLAGQQSMRRNIAIRLLRLLSILRAGGRRSFKIGKMSK